MGLGAEGAADGGQGDLLSRLSAVDRRPLRDPATAAELRRFAEQGRGRVMVVLLARAVARVLPGPITAFTATVGILVTQQQVDSVSVSVWIYVCCAWTGFIGGGVLYWLYTLAEVPLRLHRCMDLQMAWMDPAHTPAIVQLCRVYGRVAVSTAVGVLIAELSTVAAPSRPTRISGRCAASRSRPPPFCST